MREERELRVKRPLKLNRHNKRLDNFPQNSPLPNLINIRLSILDSMRQEKPFGKALPE